ncbi:ADP-ribosyltransferase [Nocardia sp. NPDC003979]
MSTRCAEFATRGPERSFPTVSEHGGGAGTFDDFPFADQVLARQTIADLTDHERSAIESYALNGYEPINSALRGSIPMTPALARRVAHIRSGLRRYPLRQTVRVTREVDAWVLGVDASDAESIASVIGEYFTELGFLSTSGLQFPPRSARHRNPVILELLVPQGTPALRLGELAEVRDEREILIIDVRTYLVANATFDERRRMWRIEAIVVQEEQ